MHFGDFSFIYSLFTVFDRSILPLFPQSRSYLNEDSGIMIVDFGSFDANGNCRDAIAMSSFHQRNYIYIGADISYGPNVDVVLDPDNEDGVFQWPFPEGAVDIIVSSSAFEHDDFFWESFLRLATAVKPGGFLVLTLPMNIPYHAYPVDNWRFFEDSPKALMKWAKKIFQYLDLALNMSMGVSDKVLVVVYVKQQVEKADSSAALATHQSVMTTLSQQMTSIGDALAPLIATVETLLKDAANVRDVGVALRSHLSYEELNSGAAADIGINEAFAVRLLTSNVLAVPFCRDNYVSIVLPRKNLHIEHTTFEITASKGDCTFKIQIAISRRDLTNESYALESIDEVIGYYDMYESRKAVLDVFYNGLDMVRNVMSGSDARQ